MQEVKTRVPFRSYLAEVARELRSVTWPTRQQTLTQTMLVIGVSALLAVYLGVLDYGLAQALALIIR
jgi:preprotein translocase SecE subunit